ncbi:MAG: hypothetical protein EBZ74_06140 [Planctomycetia bacterium]|nr:hypothetical protein [Planctomycetia bacterium]
MHTLPFERSTGPVCVLERHALVEVPLSEIGPLRDAAVPEGAPALPARFLRHCDEQTVVGVRAVLEAIAGDPQPVEAFARYGVIAAPRCAGRIAAAETLAAAAQAGSVAVSPHVVPQCSLHAAASAVSVALGMHGPNLGSSGGPEALSEGLCTALSLVHASGCAGLWLVLSEWDEEPALDPAGRPLDDPLCRAVALALGSRAAAPPDAVTFTLRAGDRAVEHRPAPPGAPSALAAFSAALGMCAAGGAIAAWSHVCPWGAEIRVAAPAVGVRTPPTGLASREAA